MKKLVLIVLAAISFANAEDNCAINNFLKSCAQAGFSGASCDSVYGATYGILYSKGVDAVQANKIAETCKITCQNAKINYTVVINAIDKVFVCR